MENESGSNASGRGALAEFKDAVTNLFDQVSSQVTSLIPDLGFGREFPRHELRVEDDGYRVLIELPGFRREEIDVSVVGRTLTVSGQRARFEPPAGGRMLRSERPSGEFELTVRLPSEVDAIAVAAQMRDGVLDVRLPESKETRGRSVDVDEGSDNQHGEPGAQADG
ncbi:MAG: Hsp20 family protein [Gemmatimonadetes bacterium]|nr:Hsp20 family protein [Gemmatimonadota bacterium]NIO30691.1 Hsp20 family protein [Gemmatimonadota bacterium]